VQRDSEGSDQPEIGSSGASSRGVEVWRKQTEPRSESDPLRGGSGIYHADEKSSKHVKSLIPVPETDTGREVE
jgi:hypothetical protein